MDWTILILIIVIVVIVIIIAFSFNGNGGDSSGSAHHFHDDSSHYLPNSGDLTLLEEEYKGYQAELSIAAMLEKIADIISGCYLINNVMVPSGKDRNGNKRTVEIDHILFTPSGLFVIETKSRAGTIYGDEEDDRWRQVLGWDDEIEHEFFNPIKQNDIHIRVLRRLLGRDKLVCYSCIVFEDGDISNIKSELVITPEELEDFILDTAVEQKYNSYDLAMLYRRILYYKEHPPKSKDEHIRDIHKNHDNYDA